MKMDAAFFLANGPDRNDIPEPAKRWNNPFWQWTAGLLGLPDASATTPARFLGLGVNREDIGWQLDAVRRRDEKMRALNAPPTRAEVLGMLAGDVVEAVKKVVRITKTQAAVEWLAQVLQQGPVPQKQIEALAVRDSIGTKPLKIAKGRLKVESVRKGRNHWAWRLPFAKAKESKEG
jgi:hypothetical protein